MPCQTVCPLSALYQTDETAWLETMSRLAAERRFEEFDCEHLSKYLNDMARRDRREVVSRMVVLMIHMLKWEYQRDRRSESWRSTLFTQQIELEGWLEQRTLRNHAVESLEASYVKARK